MSRGRRSSSPSHLASRTAPAPCVENQLPAAAVVGFPDGLTQLCVSYTNLVNVSTWAPAGPAASVAANASSRSMFARPPRASPRPHDIIRPPRPSRVYSTIRGLCLCLCLCLCLPCLPFVDFSLVSSHRRRCSDSLLPSLPLVSRQLVSDR
jgi:hypothetical protein